MQLAFLMLVSLTSAPREEPFLDLPFAAALEQARSSGKLVLVDFFTTWCAPCKKLDQVTWKDAQVRSWLAEHTVPLKIDAEKETELAARYGIQGYPSLAFIRPDGSLQDIVVGFKEPKEFLALAGDILAGKGLLDLARERLAENKDDFEARVDLARELVNHAQYPEALEHFLWCWDHGLEKNPSQVGVRGSFLLVDIARLGARYPAALKALRDRRDACRTILLDGKGDFNHARDLASLNKALDEGADTLRVYDALADLHPDDQNLAKMRRSMFPKVMDLLLEARRYQEVLDGVGDVDKAIEERIRRSEAGIDLLKGKAEAVRDAELLGMIKRQVTMEGAKVYEALLGVDRREEAEKVSARLLELDSSYAAFETLAKHAARAGASASVEQLLARAQSTLSEQEHRRLLRSAESARER